MAIVCGREIGTAGPELPWRRQCPALEINAIDDTPRAEVIVEALSHDIGERTAFALRQLLGGGGLLFCELDLRTNHAIKITDRVVM
jgi:hypothetical protein